MYIKTWREIQDEKEITSFLTKFAVAIMIAVALITIFTLTSPYV